MKMRKQIVFLIFISMFVSGISVLSSAEEELVPDVPQVQRQLDFDGDISYLYNNPEWIPTGDTYYLFDPLPGSYGGYWADAEKSPTNNEDDLACWAATASNMLEWTGWGFTGGMENGNADDFFAYFQDHTTDKGSLIEYALQWWFTGYLNDRGDSTNWSSEDVEGGDFWSSSYTWTDYTLWHWDAKTTLQKIDEWLHAGYAVGIAIYPITPPGGHAITVWGIEYDTSFDKTDPDEVHDYYLGIYVTDSDNNKNMANPPDVLSYIEVNYDDTNNYWYFGGWRIGGVSALKPFPGETRPVADAGGSYIGNEGTAVIFDASSSTDDDSLKYRWDFNNDTTWDTTWSTSSTASHTWNDDYMGIVKLEVFDGRMRDIDTTTVTINNVAPIITAYDDTINENEYVSLVVDIDDPSSEDTFVADIDWDDGSTDTFPVLAGMTIFSIDHQYLDDNPTGTSTDDYTVTVTLEDDDGGSVTDSAIITVDNVNPIISSISISNINENDIATLSGTFTDSGTLDSFELSVDWGDSTSLDVFPYAAGTSSFTETHLYQDDNPTGTPYDDYIITLTLTDDDTGSDIETKTITVNNVDPVVSIDMDQPNPQFILPLVHELDFTGSYTDVGTMDTHTIYWDFGEGDTETGTLNPSHTYDAPGAYTVTLTVTDDDTGVGTATYEVEVGDEFGALQDLDDYIQGLPDNAFKGNPVQRKNAFHQMILEINIKLVDMEYKGAIQDLRNNIREKADGLIDGKLNNDWIKTLEAQQHICMKIDDLTDYLELIM